MNTLSAGISLCEEINEIQQKECSSHKPDSKVHGANMGPIWGRQDPGGPHVGNMNFAIWEGFVVFFVSLSKLLNNSQHITKRTELHNVWNMCDIRHYFDIINKVWCIYQCHSVMQCHNPALCISLLKSAPKCPSIWFHNIAYIQRG